MGKRQRCWYLLFRMEDGRVVHLNEPLRKYELLQRLKKWMEGYWWPQGEGIL